MNTEHVSDFSRADLIVPHNTSWLWPGWLPLGKLTLFEGDPGLGKSLVTLDIAARLSSGRPMPDGSPAREPCNVVVINGEDKAHDTIIPRLIALGADLARIYIYHPDDLASNFTVPNCIEQLLEVVKATDAGLVIIDPITYFLDAKVCVNSDQSIRQALSPLDRLARKLQIAVIIVRHLNKDPGKDALYRGAGSIGCIAACRIAWLIARDPNPLSRPHPAPTTKNCASGAASVTISSIPAAGTEGQSEGGIANLITPSAVLAPPLPYGKAMTPVILAQVKNNIAMMPPSLTLELALVKDQAPTILWRGTSTWSAAQLQSGAVKPRPRDRVAELLEDFLYDRPRISTEVWAWAQRQGFGEKVVTAAKKLIGVKSSLIYLGNCRNWWWSLPHHPPIDPSPNPLDAWIKPLEQMYPPPCPLDEDD